MITKYQTSKQVEINRSDIKNAPYNPRIISEKAFSKLKQNIRKVGLLGGIVINKRTMHIVSGHQRLKALDEIEKSNDYNLIVELIDVDEKTEKEQNIFMNSKSTQGQYDMSMLSVILPDIDVNNAGLDENDIRLIMLESPTVLVSTNENIKDDFKELETDYNDRKDAIKELKNNIKDSLHEKQGDSFVVVSFDSYANKCMFMERFGYNQEDRYIKGESFSDIIERTN